MNNSEINVVQEFKYLGVNISSKCGWQKHVECVAGKGNQILRFIKRNFRDCPQAVKETLFISLVRPILEYAGCVWDPCGEGLKKDIEMVQRRAARFVLNDYERYSSVDEMLANIGWKTLEMRRRESRLCLLFKMYNGELPQLSAELNEIICQPNYVGRHDHQKKIRMVQSRLLPYHHSFFPRTIRDWNKLPQSVVDANGTTNFKELLRNL